MLNVAVVGAGPAGIYAANALSQHGNVRIDVIDRLPTPFGLVRYGVAPDHLKIKSISQTLTTMLEDSAVRFLGNIDVGRQLTLTDLHLHYDAVIFASGAPVDRKLGIPGEDLAGSFPAGEFVSWYCGHPDVAVRQFTLYARSVAVIGAGNVALDVCRILAKSADELAATDIPDAVLADLRDSRITDIHLIARRGPAQAKFTTKELREMGELTNSDVLVDPAELELDEPSQAVAESQRAVQRNLEILGDWAERPPKGRPRRVHLHFKSRPVELVGEESVHGVRLEATRLQDDGSVVGTGEFHTLDAQMVLRSIGYRGIPVLGMPFDEHSGLIPNAAGRVLRNEEVAPGEYVAGWIKRGPTGVIGTNKHDATSTVAAVLDDAEAGSLPRAPIRDPDAVLDLLAERGVDVVTWRGWLAIEAAEVALGQTQGRERSKLNDRSTLLRAAHLP